MKDVLEGALRGLVARAELFLGSWGLPVTRVGNIEVRATPDHAQLVSQALDLVQDYSDVAAARVSSHVRRIVSLEATSEFRRPIRTAFVDFIQARGPSSVALVLYIFASREAVRRRCVSAPRTEPIRLAQATLRTTSRFMRWLAIRQEWTPSTQEELFGWLFDELELESTLARRARLMEELNEALEEALGRQRPR